MSIPDYPAEWLDQVVRKANEIASQVARSGGTAQAPDPYGFPRAVNHRLSIGAEEYGDSFKRRPLAELEDELVQETPDVAAWAMLYGLRRGPEAHQAQLHLINAAALAALADQELRAAFQCPEVDPD